MQAVPYAMTPLKQWPARTPGEADGGGCAWGRARVGSMNAVDYIGFFIPLIFIVVLVRSFDHFVQHPIALAGLLLLTIVSILHFDVGMLTTDPYDAFLDDIGAPRRTWTVTVVALIVLSYSGEFQEQLLGTSKRRRRRARRTQPRP